MPQFFKTSQKKTCFRCTKLKNHTRQLGLTLSLCLGLFRLVQIALSINLTKALREIIEDVKRFKSEVVSTRWMTVASGSGSGTNDNTATTTKVTPFHNIQT